MDHFESFIRFQASSKHSDEFTFLGRWTDSRVWLAKEWSYVIKEYNRCHSRISPDTLRRYHEIHSSYARDLEGAAWTTSVEVEGATKLLIVRILELSQEDIYHERPTSEHRWRLYSKIPFVEGKTLHELFLDLARSEIFRIETQIAIRLREAGIPIAQDALGSGYPLTRENVRIMEHENEIHATVTDLWADIGRMVRFESERATI